MKYCFALVFIFFSYGIPANAQLKNIYSNEYLSDSNKNMVFEKLNIKIQNNDDGFKIFLNRNDSLIFTCDANFYYETYDQEFLIISQRNSPLGSSTLPYFYSRKISYIIPIAGLSNYRKIYQVNFDGEKIIQDIKLQTPLNYIYFKIETIDINKGVIIICDKINKVRKKYDLIPVKFCCCK